jgi:formylglycine-generating enzyme required for sulfatase activity
MAMSMSRLSTTPTLVLLLGAMLLLGLGIAVDSPSVGQEKKAANRVSVDLGGGVSLKLVRIPAGRFTMGSPKSDVDFIRRKYGEFFNDLPDKITAAEQLHEVAITRPFFMGVYEVTQAEYEKVMGKNPSAFAPAGAAKKQVAGEDTAQFPVEMVSWDEAMAFCRALGKRFKKDFDLPTEAEWEYACRAGTATTFCYGNAISPRLANVGGTYGEAPEGTELRRTTRVGSYKPNAFGLYDMHGNVQEWCKDWYAKDYYAKSPPRDPRGPDEGDDGKRVLRGGEWNASPLGARSAARNGRRPDERFHFIGFRVVVRMP